MTDLPSGPPLEASFTFSARADRDFQQRERAIKHMPMLTAQVIGGCAHRLDHGESPRTDALHLHLWYTQDITS